MNTIQNIQLRPPCSCPNQHLLNPGGYCELCMGEIDFAAVMEEVLPLTRFDDAYFEELETYFISYDTAA